MGAQCRHGAVNQRPTASDPPRQQRRVFVLGRHDDSESFKASEILRQRQGDTRASPRKGCIGHGILFEFRDVGDARVFDAPYLFRKLLRIRHQGRLRIDPPVIDSIGGTRDAQMRQAAPVFNAAKKQCISIRQRYNSRVQDAVDRVWPVFTGKNGIAGISSEQGKVGAHLCRRLLWNDGL